MVCTFTGVNQNFPKFIQGMIGSNWDKRNRFWKVRVGSIPCYKIRLYGRAAGGEVSEGNTDDSCWLTIYCDGDSGGTSGGEVTGENRGTGSRTGVGTSGKRVSEECSNIDRIPYCACT